LKNAPECLMMLRAFCTVRIPRVPPSRYDATLSSNVASLPIVLVTEQPFLAEQWLGSTGRTFSKEVAKLAIIARPALWNTFRTWEQAEMRVFFVRPWRYRAGLVPRGRRSAADREARGLPLEGNEAQIERDGIAEA
jgi:hypothetical protein